jgi:hypothetical protein
MEIEGDGYDIMYLCNTEEQQKKERDFIIIVMSSVMPLG